MGVLHAHWDADADATADANANVHKVSREAVSPPLPFTFPTTLTSAMAYSAASVVAEGLSRKLQQDAASAAAASAAAAAPEAGT